MMQQQSYNSEDNIVSFRFTFFMDVKCANPKNSRPDVVCRKGLLKIIIF